MCHMSGSTNGVSGSSDTFMSAHSQLAKDLEVETKAVGGLRTGSPTFGASWLSAVFPQTCT